MVTDSAGRSGPLTGIRVVEFAGLGPGPLAAMILADMGADVVRIDRHNGTTPRGEKDVIYRSRRSIAIDMKVPEGVDLALELIDQADVLIEGFRPGVAERLGFGPDACLARNPKLVYGRMTGWGQDGPLANAVGHDINYSALAGALYPIGPFDGPPTVPLNLVGDYGGGGMLLAFGAVAALFHAQRTGEGQVVDAAMVDGVNMLMTYFWGLRAVGLWGDERGGQRLDGSAPYYRCYTCKDGRFVAVGALEPQFYKAFLQVVDLQGDELFASQSDKSLWPEMTRRLAEIFASEPQAEWVRRAEGLDACLSPVLDFTTVPTHEHTVARHGFVEVDGVLQPAPAPRFSRTPAAVSRPPAMPGENSDEVLAQWLGLGSDDAARLRTAGALK
jgi:alpha-methylacyl-CoA racemase